MNDRSRDLDALLARLADGDRSAFDPLFDAVWPRVRAFCGRALPDPDDADDAAQQVMLAVFSRACDYDVSRPALPWILGVAWWTCRSLRRARQRSAARVHSAAPDALIADAPSPEADAIAADLRAAVQAAVADLPPLDADTLWAAMARDGQPPADDDGPSSATFRKRLQRATRRLRDLWGVRHGLP